MDNLPLCMLKHIMHVSACQMHIYAYFWKCRFVHIWFLHIFTYFAKLLALGAKLCRCFTTAMPLTLPSALKLVWNYFFNFFLVWYSWFVSSRTGPLTYDKWLITIIDLKDLLDVLIRHISSTNCCKIDFWTGKLRTARSLWLSVKLRMCAKIFWTFLLKTIVIDHLQLAEEPSTWATLPRNHSCLVLSP